MSKICGGGLVAQFCPTRVTPWTIAHQVPLSIGFSRQEYWSGLPFPPPDDPPNPGIEPISPLSPKLKVDSLLLSHWGSPEKYFKILISIHILIYHRIL